MYICIKGSAAGCPTRRLISVVSQVTMKRLDLARFIALSLRLLPFVTRRYTGLSKTEGLIVDRARTIRCKSFRRQRKRRFTRHFELSLFSAC